MRGGGAGGGKIPGARTGWGARNLDKTSGHCATVKRVGCPVMHNHLLVLGPDHGSRRPWAKALVATLKKKTGPRLELMACLVLSWQGTSLEDRPRWEILMWFNGGTVFKKKFLNELQTFRQHLSSWYTTESTNCYLELFHFRDNTWRTAVMRAP